MAGSYQYVMASPIVTENGEAESRLESLSEVDNETDKFFEAAFWSVSTELTTPSVTSDDGRAPDELDGNLFIPATTRRLVFAAKSSAPQRPRLDITAHNMEVNKKSDLVPSSAEDDVDGLFWGKETTSATDTPDFCETQHHSLTFDEKTPSQQEDLIKYVAGKLDEMAIDVEERFKHKPHSLQLPTVDDLLRIADYESFESTILQSVGADSSTNQLAIFYRLTKEIFVATTQSENGKNLLSWAKTYYRQKLAPWVVNNNGLESVVEKQKMDGTSVD